MELNSVLMKDGLGESNRLVVAGCEDFHTRGIEGYHSDKVVMCLRNEKRERLCQILFDMNFRV